MYVELTVYDGDGAPGETFEIIAFNQCGSALTTVELPDGVLEARRAALAPDASRIGPAPKMQVHVSSTGSTSENIGLYKTGSTATIDIADESFHRSGGTIVERVLADLTGDGSMYADSTPLHIRSNSPITTRVVLTEQAEHTDARRVRVVDDGLERHHPYRDHPGRGRSGESGDRRLEHRPPRHHPRGDRRHSHR